MDDIQSLIEELRFGAENGADAELLERAADKIQELVADLGDADAMTEYWMKKNKWIRCEDRLPELREEVLVYAIGKEDAFSPIIAISELYIFKLLPFSNGTLEWRDPWDYFNKNYEVTHWMPLPDAPEVEG